MVVFSYPKHPVAIPVIDFHHRGRGRPQDLYRHICRRRIPYAAPHRFPELRRGAGVVAADLSLYVDNYHAAERTFSLLTQVVGRAGRPICFIRPPHSGHCFGARSEWPQ